MNDSTVPCIDSRESCVAALHWGFGQALAQHARCIAYVDATFEHWPLDVPPLLQALTTWLRRPQRRLVLLAASCAEVPRRQPRFTAWRRDWAHAIQARQPPQDLATDLPTLLLDDRSLTVHLIYPTHWRGRARLDMRARLLRQKRIDAVSQRSEAELTVTMLGL